MEFVRGLFQNTVREFLRSAQLNHRLIVHLDADLYSSTLFVLATLHPVLNSGAILIFDEFSCVNCGFRALMDYCSSFYRKFAPVGHAGTFYEHVALRAT